MTNRKIGWYWCVDSYGDELPLFWDGKDFLTSVNYSRDEPYGKRILSVRDPIKLYDEDDDHD